MFDLNRRKLLIGSLITGAAISAPSLAFAEDRYQVLIRLQQDVLDLLYRCQQRGREYMFDIGYEAKAARLQPRYPYKPEGMSEVEFRALERDTIKARTYMNDTTRAEWKLADGDAKIETMLVFMNREFNRSDFNDPSVHQAVRALMNGEVKIDTLDADQLRMVEDAVVCIAIMKRMLSYHRIPMDTANIPAFHDFATKHRALIL